MIDENSVRNVVRNSMNNRRTRDEVVENVSTFGMRKPESHNEYSNNQRHRQPMSAVDEAPQQPINLGRVPCSNRNPAMARAQPQNADQEESKFHSRSHQIQDLILENLRAQNHQSASINLDHDKRNMQQINQIIRASNGCQEESKGRFGQGFNESDHLESLNENERSFEHEL